VDPRRFDAVIQRLAQKHSRRALVGGSVGASVLAALGLDEDARANTHGVAAEACIPTGKQCPSKKPRGKKGKKLGCKQCCQGFSIRGRRGKRKCSCKPGGQPCTADSASACCTGTCQGGVCASVSVGPQCTANGNGCASNTECCSQFCGDNVCRASICTVQGARCTGDAPGCCSGVCNARGSDIDGTANECAPCRTGGAFCQRQPDSCCAGRTCLVIADDRDVCCSLAGEACVNADPNIPAPSTCCPGFQCLPGATTCTAI
jgi:hypothetical protein